MHKKVAVPDIGMVVISKKTNATRLKLRVHPEKGVLITIPSNATYSEGERFLYNNMDWLKAQLFNQFQKKEDSIFKPDSIFITRKSHVKFYLDEKSVLKTKIKNFSVEFFYNPSLDFSNEKVQSFIKKTLIKGLEIEAKNLLIERAKYLSQKTNLKFRDISIGNAAGKWGSCDGRNNIRLSCRMLLLPNELIDYIIIHELCHIIHKNHSPKFHSLLDQLVNGKSKELNKYLKNFSNKIIPGDYSYNNSNYLY